MKNRYNISKKTVAAALSVLMAMSLTACSSSDASGTSLTDELGLNGETKPATEQTIEINSAVYSMLDFEDTQEAEFAVKGLIDAPEELEIKDKDGNVVWSQKAYAFVDNYEKAPDTVNPSLWENTRNNHAYGLFEVTDGIYQVRGYDMANLTVIKGDTGWILFDPLMSIECTQAAMELIEKNLGDYPVKAVIISHSHVDHFGGIKGVMTEDMVADASLSLEQQLASGKIPVIVPEGFEEHAVSENVYAGKAMGRRATYQYGVGLEASETGTVAMGIGMGQSTGMVTYISPTCEVKETGTKMVIDGVELEFQITPGTEAPAEMNTWIPEKKALWLAENCTGTLHNLYTLRGAQVRDGAAWARYITEAISMYGADVEVAFQSHNWPHWGNDVVNNYMADTAAVYKYINDQTLTYINQGYTSDEISNMIELPEELAKNWYTRQYYGTVAHNSKAVYQKFMGWYDANPVNLNPLEPSERAQKWVEYLGDTDEVLRKAKADYDNGEYQWVAEVTNVIVFADPDNEAARFLCADALEQLGYQAESGTWRNAYLMAAKELRRADGDDYQRAGSDFSMQKNMSATLLFDNLSILLDKNELADKEFKINFVLIDTSEQFMLHFHHGALLIYENEQADDADVTVTCPKNALLYLMNQNVEALESAAQITGNQDVLALFVENLNEYNAAGTADFNIIEP